MTTRLGYYAKKFNYVAQAMEKGDVQKWITVGHGDDAKHLPIVDGHIGHGMEGIPHDIAQKIHDGTKHPEKKAKWAEHLAKVKGGEASAAEVEPEPEPRKHTYGLRSRPASYGSVPSGYESEDIHPDFNFGTITYPHELSADEVRSYQLTKIADHEDIGTLANTIAERLPKESPDDMLKRHGEKAVLHTIRRLTSDAGMHAEPERVLEALRRKAAGQDPREAAPVRQSIKDIKLKEPLPEHSMSGQQFEAIARPLRQAQWDAQDAMLKAKNALLETTPKARRKDSDEEKFEAALKAKKNKPLVEAYEQAQERDRAARAAYEPYQDGHKLWRIQNVLQGYDVPEADPTNNPSMVAAKKTARERIALREQLKRAADDFTDAPNNASMTKLFGLMEKEIAPLYEFNQPAMRVDISKRILKHIGTHHAPLQSKEIEQGRKSLTAQEQGIVDWLRTGPEEKLNSWARGNGEYRGNDDYINTPLSEPHTKRDTWLARDVEREGRRIADEVRRARTGQPLPETAWHVKDSERPEILPYGHGILEDDDGHRVVLQLPDGQHHIGGYIRPAEGKHAEQSEYEALHSAASTYSPDDYYSRGHYSREADERKQAARDALVATLAPWKARADAREREALNRDVEEKKAKAKAIVDTHAGGKGWTMSPDEYYTHAGVVAERGYTNRGERESQRQASDREHKHIVELAHFAGYDVPDKAVQNDLTYNMPHQYLLSDGMKMSNEIGVGKRDGAVNEALTERSKATANARRAREKAQKDSFHNAISKHLDAKMQVAKWKKHEMDIQLWGDRKGQTAHVSGSLSPSGNWLVHRNWQQQGPDMQWQVSHVGTHANAGRVRTQEDAKRLALQMEMADAIPGAKRIHSATPDNFASEETVTPALRKAADIIAAMARFKPEHTLDDVYNEHTRSHLLSIAKQNGYSEEMPMQKGQTERHEEITLTPEDEEALDRAWDRIAQEHMRKGKWAERLQPVIEGGKT